MDVNGPQPKKLFDFLFSGNGYKVRLALAQLEIAVEYEFIDLLKGKTREAYFIDKNPVAQIPVLELDDGTLLRESNAILHWLTEGSRLMPTNPIERTQVLQWMFFEQSNIDKNLGRCRFMETYPEWKQFLPPKHLAMCKHLGEEALGVLNGHLEGRQFMVGGNYSAADIAVYAYVHCAGEGGFMLDDYAAVKAWCGTVKAQAGHVTIDYQP